MVKKAEGTETPEVETPVVETPEVTPPTAEEQLGALQKDLERVSADLEAKDKGLRTAHQTLTEKDKELKKRAEIDTRMDDFELTQRYLIGALQDRGVAPDDETFAEKKTDYLKGFDNFVEGKKKERDDAQAKSQQEEYNTKADAIYSRAQEAFKDDEDALFQVRTFLMSGATDLAEKKVAKVEGKATDTKENKVESEEEKFQKRLEEEKRKWMEESGMLESETGGPSGSVGSKEDAKAKYIAGEITEEEAKKRGVTFT